MELHLDELSLQEIQLQTLSAYKGEWKALPVIETGEPLMEVPSEYCHPYYAREMKLISDERIHLRIGTLERFCQARHFLNARGYDLKVYDGWRSVQLQESLWWYYMREFPPTGCDLFFGKTLAQVREICEHLPDHIRERLYAENRKYVSLPSRNPDSPSPHATGGAIDVWLYQNDRPCDLGVPFDWMEDQAGAFYHFQQNRKKFNGNDGTVCQNREHLLMAMAHAGFSSYAHEIWHFNYGNQMDALVRGGTARYSYIEPS